MSSWLEFRIVDKAFCPRYAVEVQAPRRGSPNAAGVDLWGFAPVPPDPNTALCLDWHLTAGETVCFNTNLSVRIPKGYYGRVAPGSGLALQGIHVVAGVIDMDYTGAIGVVITNISSKVLHLNLRRPIAQLIITPYSAIDPVLMYDEDDRKTLRGETGFGSTDGFLKSIDKVRTAAEILEGMSAEKRAKLESRMTYPSGMKVVNHELLKSRECSVRGCGRSMVYVDTELCYFHGPFNPCG